jgi:hypothetical protein
MTDLPNNENFLRERNLFLEKINLLPDGKFKQDMLATLTKLTNEVYKIENLHQEVIFNRRVPDEISTIRSNITSYRKHLHSNLMS